MSDPYQKVWWRGHRFDRRTVAAIKELEDRLGRRITIYQGSYNDGVSASAGSHDGGGAVDWWVTGIDPDEATRTARKVGFADWWRKPSQGPWSDHHHSILRRHKSASAFAKAQADDYDARGDGLGSLVGGDDPQPWRPSEPVTFAYRAWLRERTLRKRLRALGRDLAALRDRRAKVRKRLRAVVTS